MKEGSMLMVVIQVMVLQEVVLVPEWQVVVAVGL